MFGKTVIRKIIYCILGSAIMAFGLYNVHSFSGVTEGGILGLTLLFDHWFNISPAISGFVLNGICYGIGWRTLGKRFVVYTIIAGSGFSVFYGIFEQFPPLWPQLVESPFLAALVGAAFIGIGVGICVRAGGAPSGDDALAMSISHGEKIDIRWVYLVFDVVVLALSLTYLPVDRIFFSLISVLLSGQIVGWIQTFELKI